MKDFINSMQVLWKELGLNQKVSLILTGFAVVAGLAALVLWSQQPDMQLLYGRLSEKDASVIVSQLQAQNIPHKVANGGATVYVPADQVYRLRMDLASKGVPSGDGVGFEIFDKAQFGLSDFVQRTNYGRALQGELARTIAQLDGVRSARVMVVQPENRLLLTDQSVKPTASVFVELAKQRLEVEAVNAIRHLVANAVQGLSPDQVAVIDHRGRVLSEELRNDPTLANASSQMRYRQQVEDYFAKKVETMLSAVVGPNNTVVRVSADIDTEATTQTQEKYDPEGQVVRSQVQTEDTTVTSEGKAGGGAVGVSANTPEGAGRSDADGGRSNQSETSRKNRTTNFEIGKVVTNVSRAPGTIKSLSASVFVAARAGADGKATPRTAEELQALKQVVINALGLKNSANMSTDQMVSLQEMTFVADSVPVEIQKLQTETRIQSWLEVGSRYLPFVIALAVLGFFWKTLKKQKIEPVPMELLAEPPDATKRALQATGALTPELLNELIRQKPANIGMALREWATPKKQ
jgi:flagellar M-ring protein FliF